MSNQFITAEKSKLQFKDIVLQHLKTILELSKNEFKGNYKKTIIHTNFESIVTEEDTRKQYIQAIENLSYILLPYINSTKYKKQYDNLIKIIDIYGYEFFDKYGKELKETHKKIYGEKENISNTEIEDILIMKKLRSAKELFKLLNLLLNENDYLKGAIYGEGDLDEITDIK